MSSKKFLGFQLSDLPKVLSLALLAFIVSRLTGWLFVGGISLAAAVTTTNPADFADRTQTFFNPKLLKQLQFNLKLAGYGLSEGYRAIGTTIRFFRPRHEPPKSTRSKGIHP